MSGIRHWNSSQSSLSDSHVVICAASRCIREEPLIFRLHNPVTAQVEALQSRWTIGEFGSKLKQRRAIGEFKVFRQCSFLINSSLDV